MIKQEMDFFLLETKNTMYLFHVLETGHLEHLYYGKRVNLNPAGVAEENDMESIVRAIAPKYHFLPGNCIAYSQDDIQFGLEDRCLEFSSLGKGDIRDPFLSIVNTDGSTTSDFLYESAQILKGKSTRKTLPTSYGSESEVDELNITLRDKKNMIKLVLTYSVFSDCDIITRSSTLINEGKEAVWIDRLMSNQIDFESDEFVFTNFTGAWVREMNRNDFQLKQGKVVNSSSTGTSSNRNNPFVMLSTKRTTEDAGDCYGFNLIYSGNHYEAAEVNAFKKTRIICGINPEGFRYQLNAGEVFEAPESVMAYSKEGFNGMSHCMHRFVKKHIVRGEWKDKVRPVLLNSWEAAYFNIDESKLVSMAKTAKEAGIELFVMDDGWFGNRNDDTSSLGDWTVNQKKLPKGIKGLAEKINGLGLDFGIWVEPEMVNEDSECYRKHPDWAVKIPGKQSSLGRNQMMLDLSRKEVRDFIIESMTSVFSSANISYVKWDMNRIFTDCYSVALPKERQQEFLHRYVCGLYEVMGELTRNFPHILFEGCASGGNRFDLGMLCYMPQIWASDDTDAIVRSKIQTGYSYGYPMSVITAHVSGCPNHQTLRNTPLETRFNVAAFGILGYECNLSELSKEELSAVKDQIELYKKYRNTLQFGTYYRIRNGHDSLNSYGDYQWITVAEDKKTAVGCMLQTLVTPNLGDARFFGKGLDETKRYHFRNREFKINVKEFGDLINSVAPIHIKKDSLLHDLVAKVVKMNSESEDYIVPGGVLNEIGIGVKQGFMATGFDSEIRHYQDFSSRIYFMDEESFA